MPRLTHMVVPTLLCTLQACTTNTQLYTAYHTVVGVDASVSADRTSGHMLIGYDRSFLTISPRGVDGETSASGNQKPAEEVMSALSCSSLVIDGIFITEYRERLATGNAALEFLKNATDQQLGEWRNCDAGDSQ